MNKKLMQQQFKDILTDDSGLHLISTPTGSGKTTQIINAMLEYIKEHPNDKRKFIFLGPQKKNLQYERFLNVSDAVIIYGQKDCINNYLKKNKLFDNLPFYPKVKKETIYIYKVMSSTNKEHEDLENNLSEFYKALHKYINKEIEALVKMCTTIKSNGEKILDIDKLKIEYDKFLRLRQNAWIRDLSPEYYLFNKKIGVMTYDKFLSPIHCGILPTIDFMHPNRAFRHIIEKGYGEVTIICDELDTLKEISWKKIISNSISEWVDTQKVLEEIGKKDINNKFNPILNNIYIKSKSHRDRLSQKLEEMEQYHFNSNFFIDTNEYKENLGIFDSSIYPIVNNFSDRLYLKFDQNTNQVVLNDTDYTDEENKSFHLNSVTHSAISAIKNFQSLISHVSLLYYEYKKKKQGLSTENTLHTILDYYHFNPSEQKFLANINIYSYSDNKSKKQKNLNPMSRGFHYTKIVNNPNHDDRSQFSLYSVPTNPDVILGDIADNFNVIGLTANGSIQMYKNYSYDYLFDVLGERLHLKHQYIDDYYTWYYNKVQSEYINKNIHVEAVFSADCQEKNILDDNINDWLIANIHIQSRETYNVIKNIIEGYKCKYYTSQKDSFKFELRRFLEIVSVIADFLKDKNHHRGLFFTQFGFNNDGKYYLRQQCNVEKIIFAMSNEFNINSNNVATIFYNKDTIEEFKHNLKKAYEDNKEKILIFSSHNSVSTGVNLQGTSSSPEDIIIKIEDDSHRATDKRYIEKDIDFLYIGSVHFWRIEAEMQYAIRNGIATDKHILDLIRKVVELLNRNAISFNTLDDYHRIMTYIINGNLNRFKIVSPLITNTYLSQILQSTGRITRTFRKNPYVKIVLSSCMKNDIVSTGSNFYLNSGTTMTPEFRAVFELLSKEKMFTSTYKNNMQECKIRTQMSWNFMRDRIKVFFKPGRKLDEKKEEAIHIYDNLRVSLLKSPTFDSGSDACANNDDTSIFWISFLNKLVNKYNYRLPFKPQGISQGVLYGNFELLDTQQGIEVSQEAANLPVLMQNKNFRDAFEENGYATEWKKCNNILNPYAFTIYKGILGEVIGEIIFEKYLGCKLMPLSHDCFEYFDFCMADIPNVMIDFKDWSSNFVGEPRKNLLKKIQGKMDIVNTDIAFIIRLFADDYNRDVESFVYENENNRKTIISVPGLLTKDGKIANALCDKFLNIISAYSAGKGDV